MLPDICEHITCILDILQYLGYIRYYKLSQTVQDIHIDIRYQVMISQDIIQIRLDICLTRPSQTLHQMPVTVTVTEPPECHTVTRTVRRIPQNSIRWWQPGPACLILEHASHFRTPSYLRQPSLGHCRKYVNI